jgi:hypothetical protein
MTAATRFGRLLARGRDHRVLLVVERDPELLDRLRQQHPRHAGHLDVQRVGARESDPSLGHACAECPKVGRMPDKPKSGAPEASRNRRTACALTSPLHAIE